MKNFEPLFGSVAAVFTLESFAEPGEAPGGFVRQDPQTSIWDALDHVDVHGQEYIDIGHGKRVHCRHFFRKAMRVLFFMMLTEFESKLFRVEEMQGKDISMLNDKHLNDFIKEIADSDLAKRQSLYSSPGKFKEDMRTVAAFRNTIMHINRRFKDEVPLEILVRRKKQVVKILRALSEILDFLEGHLE